MSGRNPAAGQQTEGPPKQNGVTIGTVEGVYDEQKMCRVDVKYVNGERGTARVATAFAGNKKGMYFKPDVGDQVVVAFVNGNRNDPVVLGSVWSGKQTPPTTSGTTNPVKMIQTDAGHTIYFDDTQNMGGITVQTAGGQSINIDDTSRKVEIEDANMNKLTMDSSGISLSSMGEISISATKGVSISGAEVSVSGTGKTEISANGQLQLSSNGLAQLSSKGMLKLGAKGMLQAKSSGMMQLQGAMIYLN